MLAVVVTQLCTAILGDARVGVEQVGALLALGILQLLGVQALDHHQRRLAGLRIEHRKIVRTQGQGPHAGGHGGSVDGFGGGEKIGTAIKGGTLFGGRVEVRQTAGMGRGRE